MKEIPEDISKLTLLTNLSLSYNKLKKFPVNVIGLTALARLHFVGNELEEVPEDISKLTSLTYLNLSHNQLQEIPEGITKLTSLIILNLSRNQLKEIPDTIKNLTSLTNLSLSNNQLQEIPDAIKNLTSLTHLSLFRNQLNKIPESISQLASMTSLLLSYNKLKDMPESITKLSSLTTLRMSQNWFRKFPEIIAKLTSLTNLDLSDNGLKQIPGAISNLTLLTNLNLSRNELSEIPDAILKLSSLTNLYLSDNRIKQIPEAISNLTLLTNLNLSRNELSEIPDSISNLTLLTNLYLSRNKFREFPKVISALTLLDDLDLSGNELNTIPESVFTLTSLTNLDLSRNKLREFPKVISKLTALDNLDLSRNELSEIPDAISNLISLTNLDLSSNQMKEIPKAIFKVTSLTTLNIASNKLQDVPDTISNLTSLSDLILSDNQMKEIPRAVFNVVSLNNLRLDRNLLKEISDEISKLIYLTNLDLENNQLKEIPKSLHNLTSLKDLDLSDNKIISIQQEILKNRNVRLYDNPLEDPPMEIVEQGEEAIYQYFEEVKKGDRIPLNEVKIVLVGNGEAGKTNLIRRFFNEPFIEAHDATDGISIREDKYVIQDKEIRVHFWDFGGQEIMHSTHQFFLTRKTVYVLVLDGRKDERPEEWLGLIKTFSGDSPILVVINKIDQNVYAEVENKRLLNEKYPSIDGNFFKISCKLGTGIDELKNRLMGIIYDMPTTRSYWSKAWLNVKQYLETNSSNYISHEEFLKKCEQEGISEESQEILLEYLHNLGVLLHFDDIPVIGTKVLKAKWVTEAIYKIINSSLAESKKGFVHIENDLPQILDKNEYPVFVYPYIINLMKKFELCYSISDSSILIPDQLDKEEPDHKFEEKDSLKFLFEYKEYLSRNILVRFIVEKHKEIYQNFQWRTGVILSNTNFNAKAYIRADYSSKIIYIYVNGERKRDYFATLWDSFKKINSDYKTEINEKIPVPNTTYLITYNALLNYEKQGEYNPFIGDLDKRINVIELLDGIEDPRTRQDRLKEELKPEKYIHEQHIHFHEGDNYENIETAIIKSNIKTKEFNQTKQEGISAEQLQEILVKLIAEFNTKKNYPSTVEEKLDDLYELIDETVQSSFKNRTYFESKVLKKWLPNYNELNDLSVEYLLSAEFLFDSIYKSGGADYSPFILQYCRSIENELKKKIFEAFKTEFNTNHASDMNTFLNWDCNKANKNKRFAEAISKPDKDFMLGDMIIYLGNVNDSYFITNSPLIQEFKLFLDSNFDINALLAPAFLKNLSDMKDQFRNEAAHPNEKELDMDLTKAQQGQTFIRKILNDWIECHK